MSSQRVDRVAGGGRILPDQRTDVDHFDRADAIAEIRRVQPHAEAALGIRLDDKSDAYLGGYVFAMRQAATFATAPRVDAVAVAERADEVRLDDEGRAQYDLEKGIALAHITDPVAHDLASKRYDKAPSRQRKGGGR